MNITLLSTRSSIFRFCMPMTSNATSSLSSSPYAGWTRERLVERLLQLEGSTSGKDVTVGSLPSTTTTTLPQSALDSSFDFSKHPRRKIALKFCYSGWEYGGLAYQIGRTPLPAVENVLFDAMAKAHLIDPNAGLDGCGWERCGRTDRGVSAAGQVVSLWVRSQIPITEERTEERQTIEDVDTPEEFPLDDAFGALTLDSDPTSTFTSNGKESKPNQEIDYLTVLNRLLPDTIRIIAWSPVSDTFSARFSCKYRHYKYFFSSLHLDIPGMQSATSRLLGEHDFRNLCKLDVQKQLTSFKRKILRASIAPLLETDKENDMYVFDLVGTAFLYHQVRHIMAALFLVGSGLEPPMIITELMNVEAGAEPLREEDAGRGTPYAIVGAKPEYQMADALPLMLWECGYDESELDWRSSGEGSNISRWDLYHQMEGVYTRSRVCSALDQHFMNAVGAHHHDRLDEGEREGTVNVRLGGGTVRRFQKYKPLLERNRLDTVEVMNERWRLGKGMRRDARKAAEAAGDEDE